MSTLDERYSDPGTSAVPWQETLRVIEEAPIFRVTTVRPDGRPHSTPLVAVWLDGALHFATGDEEQKFRNLTANPHVLLSTGNGDEWERGLEVVVEGVAERVRDRDLLARLAEAWTRKWDGRWRFEADPEGFRPVSGGAVATVQRVVPTAVLAFGKGTFTHTRYAF